MFYNDHEFLELNELFYAERYDNYASGMLQISRIGWRCKNRCDSIRVIRD